MVTKLKKSLAFRMPVLYKKILGLTGNSPRLKQNKGTESYHLVMLCGIMQLDLLNETLFSIRKNFDAVPAIYLFTDKELNPDVCRKAIKWTNQDNITIISITECLTYHQKSPSLCRFIDSNPMGLKLAAILQVGEKGKPVLYSDTDVLWFRDPFPELDALIQDKNIRLSLSLDFQPAYDQNLITKGKLEILNQEPFYCAGILLFKNANPLHQTKLDEMIELASHQSNHFTEQTIFSYLCKLEGNVGLNADQFFLSTEDQFSIMPKKREIIARHYIGPNRHLFWRDAFFSRLGYRGNSYNNSPNR
jgi:hypothetical protein